MDPVAGNLESDSIIDWISEIRDDTSFTARRDKNNRLRVLLLGGCDLEQMCHYVDAQVFDVIKEFNYPNNRGFEVHREHTQFLKISKYCAQEEKDEISRVAFCDKKMFDTILFSDDYDVLVYSVLMNYTQDIFAHKSGRWSVAYGGYTRSEDDIACVNAMSEEDRYLFLNNYVFKGQQTTSDFLADLEWLRKIVNKPIVFINGAEVPDFNSAEIGAFQRHHELNNVLDGFIRQHKDCYLLDLRNIIDNKQLCKDNLRHYQRSVYVKMAEQLMTLLNGTKANVSFRNNAKGLFVHLIREVKHSIKMLLVRLKISR